MGHLFGGAAAEWKVMAGLDHFPLRTLNQCDFSPTYFTDSIAGSRGLGEHERVRFIENLIPTPPPTLATGNP